MRLHTALACVAALFIAVSLFSHTVAARLLLLAAGIVLASVVLVRERANLNPLFRLPPVWIPFALWAAWALLSVAWSLDADRSLKEWRNEVFYTGAGLWICYVGAQARHAARIFLAIGAIAALAVCAVSVGEYLRGYDFYQRGWHGGPGNHSSALLVLMPCAVIAGWQAARQRWPLWIAFAAWGLVALFLVSAYTTLNRTIWLGFAVEVIVLGVLVLRRGAAPTRRAKLVLAALAAAALAGSAAMIHSIQAERQVYGPVREIVEDNRLTLWPAIVERVGERPLTGYGFGRGLLREALRGQEFETLGPNIWHAHNIFLDAVVQTGVPGVLLLAALLAAIALAGWRLAGGADEAAAVCGIALLAVLAGMLVRNMTDTLLVRQNALLFWAVTGVLLGLAARPWRA